MPLLRARIGMLRGLALIGLLPGSATPQERVATEVLVPPAIKAIDVSSRYPIEEQQRGQEGWVQLSYMVDTKGNPFEITVVDSSGSRAFERAAINSLEHARIEAGKLNGQPVESASELKLTFTIGSGHAGASRSFVHTYGDLLAAIKANSRPAADGALKGLTITNLYEDAYFGLASYQYAQLWGDESQQLAGLSRAIARDHFAHYLPKREFAAAVLQSLKIELKDHRYAEAMTAWGDLQKSEIDPAVLTQIRPVFDQLERLRSDATEYDVAGSMPDGTWHLVLFKKGFRARVISGHISDVKLRCAKGFVRFAFDPALQYALESKYGSCQMELEGEPGTQFVLTQI